jgi:hypothetical protein
MGRDIRSQLAELAYYGFYTSYSCVVLQTELCCPAFATASGIFAWLFLKKFYRCQTTPRLEEICAIKLPWRAERNEMAWYRVDNVDLKERDGEQAVLSARECSAAAVCRGKVMITNGNDASTRFKDILEFDPRM